MRKEKIFLACFFLSGTAGLIYQVTWIRILSLVFGNTIYAVSMVVAAFLSGLAIGSVFWGKRADESKNPLSLYINLEIGIAVSAIAVTLLIYLLDNAITSMMTPESVTGGGWLLLRFVLVFVILLLPTALMGGTLPVMGRFLTTEMESLGLSVGSLYAVNTWGGMAGAFASGFLIMPLVGVRGTLAVAFAMNVAVAAALWGRRGQKSAEAPLAAESRKSVPSRNKKKEEQNPSVREHKYSTAMVLGLFAVSGFCSLAFEVLWTRAFVISFKSTIYLFSNLLAVFLLGMALGSWALGRRVDAIKDPLRWFGLAMTGIGLYGLFSIVIFINSVDLALGIGSVFGEMNWAKDSLSMFILMMIAFLPATFLMGLAYPLICRIVVRNIPTMGKTIGDAYAVGTFGGIAGSLAAGYGLLPLLGVQNSILMVSGAAIAAGFVAIMNSTSRKGLSWVLPAAAIPFLTIVILLQIVNVNIGLPVRKGETAVFAREGIMGTVRVMRKTENGPLSLMVNNYQLATSGDVAVRFGHMPLLLKPETKDVLLISLGSGITAGSVGAHDVKSIDCVELVPTLMDVQPLFAKDNHDIVADPRFKVTFWDGRHYVKTTRKKYDMVISDLFQPDSAGEGSLYALEHYENIKSILKDGGAMAQWLPLYQLSPEDLKVILRTIATAYEHVSVWYGDVNSQEPTLLVIASQKPLVIMPDRLAKELEIGRVKDDMIESADPLSFLSFYVMDREGVMDFTKGAGINTDDNSLIEYMAPRNVWKRKENAVSNFASLIDKRRKVAPLVAGAMGDTELLKALDRYYEARTNILKGKVEHALNNYPKELDDYQKAASYSPHDPNLALAAFDLGYLYYFKRDYTKAASIFQWTTQIYQNLLEAHFYLMKSYINLGMREAATKAFDELKKLRPDVAEKLVGLNQ